MDWKDANLLIFEGVNVNVFSFLLTWIITGFGMMAAGHYLAQAININKAMRAMRPANRSITAHHAIRVIRVSWKLLVLVAVLAFIFVWASIIAIADNLYTLLLAMTFLFIFAFLWRIFDKHCRFIELLALSTLIPFACIMLVTMPGLLIGSIFVLIIAWKIIGSRGYADGMLLRDYMIDNARDYYGRKARRG